MRFGDWITYWYENHSKPTIRPSTQKGYEALINGHAIPGLGHIPLNKLTQADCQKFLNELKTKAAFRSIILPPVMVLVIREVNTELAEARKQVKAS